jgi:hypothetical protein
MQKLEENLTLERGRLPTPSLTGLYIAENLCVSLLRNPDSLSLEDRQTVLNYLHLVQTLLTEPHISEQRTCRGGSDLENTSVSADTLFMENK